MRFFEHLWYDFPMVTCAKPGRTLAATHHIKVGNASPVQLQPYAIPHSRWDGFKEELQKLMATGFIKPSDAPWAAPIFPVPKKTPGKIRLVCDYRCLNAAAILDPYFQPRIEEVLEKLVTASLYMTLDFASGFYQVLRAQDDKDKTTVISPYGKFRFIVMPFWLCNAPATFQWIMDGLLLSHTDYTSVYIDDVGVFSNTWEEHKHHLTTVFDILRNAGLTIQAAKAQLTRHRIRGGYVLHMRLKSLGLYPTLFQKGSQGFIGHINYYRGFIPHISTLSTPLTDLLQLHKPDPVDWNNDCATDFATLKESLCSAPVLSPPDYSCPFILQTDASGFGIGAVLAQETANREEHPRECRYSATEQEGLAVMNAYMHFMPYMLGHPFTVVIDHKTLSFLPL